MPDKKKCPTCDGKGVEGVFTEGVSIPIIAFPCKTCNGEKYVR